MLNYATYDESEKIDEEFRQSQSPNDIQSPVVNPEFTSNIDILQVLNEIEEAIATSPRLPFVGLTVVDEESILDRLDLLKNNLPDAIAQAWQVLSREQEIIRDAENYAKEIVAEAERDAAQILSEQGILRQAELEANQIRLITEQECDRLRHNTLLDIEEMRHTTRQEIEQWRELAMAESQEIQNGADDYADNVLDDLEQKLSQMLKIINKSREQLIQDNRQ
jgi:cell division septum initiation protein DivIVA